MAAWIDRLKPDRNLSRLDVQKGLGWVLADGMAAKTMETLSLGPFLVGFALTLGAGNTAIGILAAIPHLAQLAQLPSVYLIERLKARRLICVIGGALSRPGLLIMALALLVPSPDAALWVLGAGILVRYLIGSVVSSSWHAWMRDLVPQASMGRFFSRRLAAMAAISTALSLVAAAFVDHWGERTEADRAEAYAILFVVAFVAGCVSVYCLARTPEPPMSEGPSDLKLMERLARPLRDGNFRRLMIFMGTWNFAVNLAAPFFAVYLFTRLGLGVTLVTLLTILSQVTNVLVVRTWGQIADRFSNKSVLAVCAPLFIACIFAWTFTTFPEKHVLTMPLLVVIHLALGVATAGVNLASGNIGLKLAPQGEAAAYLSSLALINALAAGLAPVLGGIFADYLVGKELAVSFRWTSGEEHLLVDALNLRSWDFFFLVATIIGLFALHLLARVREVGEVEEKVVVAELMLAAKRSVRNLSTVAGLRAAADYPFEALRRAQRRRRRRTSSGTEGAEHP